MTSVILRAMTQADIPALSQLASDAFIAKFGHLYSAANLAMFLDDVLSPAAIAGDYADPQQIYCLAEADGALMGFAKIGLKPCRADHARGAKAMELKQLYTAAGATGQGIGGQLMDWAMAQFAARGADEVQLSVYAENFGGHRFYERYGFAKVADITFQVGDHIDPEFLFARMLR
ncbi:GNAT family N-acetyltransferase [Novosphingobium sp.]|uniref:GNAT family N-acetyltransferase n=1 Tax=Novosphingobium sp. TaxID=1874826 RepID=UPI0025DC43F9|nr:GNAT family N-acetyltransferase [Novosphingobium sp.]